MFLVAQVPDHKGRIKKRLSDGVAILAHVLEVRLIKQFCVCHHVGVFLGLYVHAFCRALADHTEWGVAPVQ